MIWQMGYVHRHNRSSNASQESFDERNMEHCFSTMLRESHVDHHSQVQDCRWKPTQNLKSARETSKRKRRSFCDYDWTSHDEKEN